MSFSLSARAQTIAVVNETSLPRIDKDGNPIGKRPLTQEPEGVSFQDCIDNQKIRFTLQMADFVPNASVEAWAGLSGADCKGQTARSGNAQVCWNLVTGIFLQQVVNVDIPVRTIMSGTGAGSATSPNTGVEVCGTVDFTTVDVHFLYFNPGDRATASVDKSLAIKIDTIGPSAPTGLRVFPGNGRISVEWANISGEGGVSLLTGVRVYCDPISGGSDAGEEAGEDAGQDCREEPIDAGEDADGGDAGTQVICTPREAGTNPPADGECTSPNLAPPDGGARIPDADFNARFQCGSFTGNAGTSVVASSVGGNPLVNGTRYAVAVAATDALGNVGPLSGPLCEVPEPTTDFWDEYKKAGGRAGGGYCTASGAGMPIGSLSVCGVFVVLVFSSLRRSWRRRR